MVTSTVPSGLASTAESSPSPPSPHRSRGNPGSTPGPKSKRGAKISGPVRRRPSPPARPREPRLFSDHYTRMNRIIKAGKGWTIIGIGKRIVFSPLETRLVVLSLSPGLSKVADAQLRGLQRLLDHENIVRMLGFRGFGAIKQDLIYPIGKTTTFEFCDHGSLHQIIKKYPDGLPERFVWHVLCSVLRALLWLHTGTREVTETGDNDFRPLLHNYINPRAIFLNCRDWLEQTDYSKEEVYPNVKLGNFKKALKLPSLTTEAADFDDWREVYPNAQAEDATYFEAPEMFWSIDHDPYRCASDIWSVGAVAVQMMGGVSSASYLPTKVKDFSYKSMKKTFWAASELPLRYSKKLRTFLEGLLVLDPTKRLDTANAYVRCLECCGKKQVTFASPLAGSPRSISYIDMEDEDLQWSRNEAQHELEQGNGAGSPPKATSPPTPQVPGAYRRI